MEMIWIALIAVKIGDAFDFLMISFRLNTSILYTDLIHKKSRLDSHGRDSGVVILTNKPYKDGPGGAGQYTFKIYHIGSKIPMWIRSVLPSSALEVHEEAWNAYPYTKTRHVGRDKPHLINAIDN
ncbi:phosphatidylinositol transfer protein [Dictyocaulus viviparus]|uniref:Phosphatidylinositol transfer protein n=1 Tax=Dictyocaulus viviparus TaxID=29172 RepID=A0A0D8XLB9_DICVI|nr:phosphatidylinositol transfer protein [Dictyocaulus viviparus]